MRIRQSRIYRLPMVLLIFVAPASAQLYVPAVTYNVLTEPPMAVQYTDITGGTRTVKFAIRGPQGKPGPLPVMIWSHGGGGLSSPLTAMQEWAEVTASAGYLSITPAHEARTGKDLAALCATIGVSPADCMDFESVNVDRPYDIRAIIDELYKMNAAGKFASMIDLSKIADGGHSSGSGGALTVAGAARMFVAGPPIAISDPRPIAFVALSPEGPGRIGFFDTDFQKPFASWDNIGRPVFIATGDGDEHCDGSDPSECLESPHYRAIVFRRIMAGTKYFMYIHDHDAFHSMFSLNVNDCPPHNVSKASCSNFAKWISTSVLAFLDASVQNLAPAWNWLNSGNQQLNVATGGVAELKTK